MELLKTNIGPRLVRDAGPILLRARAIRTRQHGRRPRVAGASQDVKVEGVDTLTPLVAARQIDVFQRYERVAADGRQGGDGVLLFSRRLPGECGCCQQQESHWCWCFVGPVALRGLLALARHLCGFCEQCSCRLQESTGLVELTDAL